MNRAAKIISPPTCGGSVGGDKTTCSAPPDAKAVMIHRRLAIIDRTARPRKRERLMTADSSADGRV
jgi:hypothetical protein